MKRILGPVTDWRLEVVAFVVGLVIMSFELAAARAVAPYLGSTIYTWTSIIGVILAALAGGYALGGVLADNRQRRSDIALLLLAAAGAILAAALFKDNVLMTISQISLPRQLQGFVASLLLFAPPTFLLGMTSPYLARISITEVATSGRQLSRINAFETVGSLLGTFLTGYILFGLIGNQRLIIGLALLLVGASLFVQASRFKAAKAGLMAAIIMFAVAPSNLQLSGLVSDQDTSYSRVVIRDITYGGQEVRVLQTDNYGLQSGVYKDGSKELAFGYTRAFNYASELVPQAQNHLIIGGGAFTFPEVLAKKNPHSKVDTVEIDPRLTALSKQYLNFQPPANLNIINTDGRRYLNQTTKQYDVIYIDAFTATVPPFQLTTLQAVQQMRAALTAEGIVVANVIAAPQGPKSDLIQYIYNTFGRVFTNVEAYQVIPRADHYGLQNILLIASNRPVDTAVQAEVTSKYPEFQTMLDSRINVPYKYDTVLTDDFAPVEQLAQ